MPNYRVLRPIEHNRILHVPENPEAPAQAFSGADGKEISVDASGLIELSEEQAAAFTAGQIERVESQPSLRVRSGTVSEVEPSAVSAQRSAETKKS